MDGVDGVGREDVGGEDVGVEGWSAYLDAVEAAARTVERLALDPTAHPGTLVDRLPAPVPPPACPWPAALEGRRQQVLATLAAATATVERRRDGAAAALAALARRAHPPSSRPAAGYTDGAALDVVG